MAPAASEPIKRSAIDPVEFEAYRRRHVRIQRISSVLVYVVPLSVGLGVGFLWSFAVSIPLAAILVLAGWDAHLRWDKARWIKRFPELADPSVKWHRTHRW